MTLKSIRTVNVKPTLRRSNQLSVVCCPNVSDFEGELFASAEKNSTSFYEKNNKAAGTRLTNAMQIKAAASDIRKELTAKKKQA